MSSPERQRVQVRDPAGILAVVPHLFGFVPARSLVIIAVGGPHALVRLGFRYDLPDPPSQDEATYIAEHMCTVFRGNHATTAIIVGYGPGTLVTPLTDVLRHALPRAGIRLHEALRVDEGRYWSYLCPDPACCPPDGTPIPGADHPLSARLASSGLTVAPSREALAATIAPAPGQDAIAAATRTARSDIRAQITGEGEQAAVATAKKLVQDAITAYRAGESITDLAHLARLTVALDSIEVRDDAWARMRPEHRADHIRLWTDVTRYAAPGFVAAPASLLAFTAWQAGDGALGMIALDRAQDDNPDYTMAQLIRDALSCGLPPSAAELSMTPEEVAESFDERRRKDS
jgi:uncharacterized protein DUF4192